MSQSTTMSEDASTHGGDDDEVELEDEDEESDVVCVHSHLSMEILP